MTYPVRCVRLAEILGLLALLVKESNPELSGEISRWLVTLCEKQPGVAHPISDQYAVSVIPAVLALATVDREEAETHLERCTVWLCDRYERDALGLAREDPTPEEEIEYLIGGPFESVQLERRPDSLVAPVLLTLPPRSAQQTCTATSTTTCWPCASARKSFASPTGRTSIPGPAMGIASTRTSISPNPWLTERSSRRITTTRPGRAKSRAGTHGTCSP